MITLLPGNTSLESITEPEPVFEPPTPILDESEPFASTDAKVMAKENQVQNYILHCRSTQEGGRDSMLCAWLQSFDPIFVASYDAPILMLALLLTDYEMRQDPTLRPSFAEVMAALKPLQKSITSSQVPRPNIPVSRGTENVHSSVEDPGDHKS
ncbi:hypothetical protein Pfo_011596 [Paulownia fortunei]|nr:hypothetical protein Pfo_011596 [Paulownia fortunei]